MKMSHEVKTEKRQLRYEFTAPELHDFSIELAQKNKAQVSLENEKNGVQSQYASRLKVLKAEIGDLSNKVADGWELRDIECTVEYNKPSAGMKTYTRKDNGKTFVERMDNHDFNLFNQQQEEDNQEETEDATYTTEPADNRLLPGADKGDDSELLQVDESEDESGNGDTDNDEESKAGLAF